MKRPHLYEIFSHFNEMNAIKFKTYFKQLKAANKENKNRKIKIH